MSRKKDYPLLREEYRSRLSSELDKLLNTSFIQICVTRLGFQNYEFCVPSMNDLDEIHRLIVDSYSNHNAFCVLFPVNDTVKLYWKDALEFIIKGGRSLMARDKFTGKIDAVWCYDDICDDYSKNIRLKGKLMENKYGQQLAAQFVDTPLLKKVFKEYSQNKYGTMFIGHFQAKNANINKAYLSFFLTTILGANLLLNHCGYKYWYGKWSHASNIRMAKSIGANEENIIQDHDWSQFRFDDGSSLSHQFERLKDTKGYNDEMMDKLKQNCRFQDIVFTNKNVDKAIELIARKIIYTSSKL